MTRLFFMPIAIVAMLVSTGYCQPKIDVIGTHVVDLGKVYNSGDHILRTFQIKNAGDQPLHITGVRTSCGCTAAIPSDSTIPPGGESQIKVDFNPAGYSGKVEKFIYVVSNDPQNPMVTLELMMDISYAIQSEPNFILFPNAKVGTPDTSAVVLINNSSDEIRIDGVETNSKEIFSHVEKTELQAGESTRLVLCLTGEKAGPAYGDVIVHTSSKLQPTVVIRYYGGVEPGQK